MTINLTPKNALLGLQMLLLVSIFGLLLWSQPWNGSNSDEVRKITVTGESVLEAEPDEFLFNPYFESSGVDQDALKQQLTTQTNQVVDALKELGVDEKDVKLDASSYDNWYWKDDEQGTLNAYLQIKLRDKGLTQKVQDYLLTTEANGQLTPQASFSEAKKKELDMQAIDQAIDDAKSRAEQQADRVSSKIGKVLELSQQQDSVFPVAYDNLRLEASEDSSASLPVLSGQDEYRQTVTVTYELQ